MRFKRKVSIEKGHLDLAPLIDVIFLLLIFFMLTSSFVFQPGIRVNLPRAVTSETLHRELVLVVITEQNEIYIEERLVGDEEMVAYLSSAASGRRPVLIKADEAADLGRVITVWDVCRKVGISQINIATMQ